MDAIRNYYEEFFGALEKRGRNPGQAGGIGPVTK